MTGTLSRDGKSNLIAPLLSNLYKSEVLLTFRNQINHNLRGNLCVGLIFCTWMNLLTKGFM